MVESGKHKPTVLIIDDDEQMRNLLTRLLGGENDCTAAESAEAAAAVVDATTPAAPLRVGPLGEVMDGLGVFPSPKSLREPSHGPSA